MHNFLNVGVVGVSKTLKNIFMSNQCWFQAWAFDELKQSGEEVKKLWFNWWSNEEIAEKVLYILQTHIITKFDKFCSGHKLETAYFGQILQCVAVHFIQFARVNIYKCIVRYAVSMQHFSLQQSYLSTPVFLAVNQNTNHDRTVILIYGLFSL